MNVTELMDTPPGLVRRGDEFHDPKNWERCSDCGVDCPIDSTDCFNCGAELEGAV